MVWTVLMERQAGMRQGAPWKGRAVAVVLVWKSIQ